MLHSAKLANVEVGAICDPDERWLQNWVGELEKQAGKHVYVEKPVSHNLFEGRKSVESVRKYNRISHGGIQRRSDPKFRKAVQLLRESVIVISTWRAPLFSACATPLVSNR